MRFFAIFAIGILGLSLASCMTPGAEEALLKKAEARIRPSIPRPEEDIVQDAMTKVFPAVVFIKPIQKEFRGGKMEKIQTFGSGVIIDTEVLCQRIEFVVVTLSTVQG